MGRRRATIAAACLGVVALAGWLLAPRWVRARAISTAAEHGIDLGVDDASIGWGRVRLIGVTAAVREVPQATLRAREVEVELSGASPTSVRVREAEVLLDGPHDRARAGLERWMAGQARAGKPQLPVAVESVHAVWSRPFGEGTRVEVLEGQADVKGDELHALAPSLTAHVHGVRVGPWRVELDRASASSKLRVAFDAEAPKGPSATLVGDADAIHELHVDVPKTPVVRLGVPAVLGTAAQLEAKIDFSDRPPGAVEASCEVKVHDARFSGAPTPLEVRFAGRAKGDARGAKIEGGELAFGPLKSEVTGTVRRGEAGARVELAWRAGPVPCAAFLSGAPPGTKLTPGTPRDIADQIGKLVVGLGLDAGEYRARAEIVLDTGAPDQSRASFVPESTCK